MLNRHLHLRIKVREKHHHVNPVKSLHSNGVNLGLILLVVLASAITWFLAEFMVLKLQEISDNYDSVALELVREFRPGARAQTGGSVYYVTQNGGGGSMSVAQFNALSGNRAGNTFYFSGIFTSQIAPNLNLFG